MADIRQIYKDGVEVYPVTKVEAVRDNNGAALQTILDQKLEESALSGYATAEQVDTRLALKADNVVGGSSALAGMTVQQALEYLLALHNS